MSNNNSSGSTAIIPKDPDAKREKNRVSFQQFDQILNKENEKDIIPSYDEIPDDDPSTISQYDPSAGTQSFDNYKLSSSTTNNGIIGKRFLATSKKQEVMGVVIDEQQVPTSYRQGDEPKGQTGVNSSVASPVEMSLKARRAKSLSHVNETMQALMVKTDPQSLVPLNNDFLNSTDFLEDDSDDAKEEFRDQIQDEDVRELDGGDGDESSSSSIVQLSRTSKLNATSEFSLEGLGLYPSIDPINNGFRVKKHFSNQRTANDLHIRLGLKHKNILKNYVLHNVLGYGGGGSTVYLASDTASAQGDGGANNKNKTLWAIKSLPFTSVALHPQLLSEINILKKLSHPSIIQLREVFMGAKVREEDLQGDRNSKKSNGVVKGSGKDDEAVMGNIKPGTRTSPIDECLYIVMEKGGIELFDLLVQRKKFPESEARYIMYCLVRAVSYMHERLICHRDLKPENILCSLCSSAPNGQEESICQVKIVDFGLAKLLQPSGDPMYSPGVGTMGYKAPEQFHLERHRGYRHSVDMWSLGVIAYILLVGYPPFRSQEYAELASQSPEEIERLPFWLMINEADEFLISSICDENVPVQFEANLGWSQISEDAISFVRALLQKDPIQRLGSRNAIKHPWFQKYESELEARRRQ